MTRAEAIEVYNGLINTKIKEAFEFFAPELKESEDDRIIKKLQEYVKNRNWPLNGPTQAEVLAWLEKQKENPKSADSIPSDCVSDAKYGNSRHKVGDSLEGRKLADEVVAYLIKSGYQPIIKDTLDQKHFQIKIPRHKEDFWHSEEYKHCREILDEYYYEGDFAGDVYTLYVLRQKEQKPVEWSEVELEFRGEKVKVKRPFFRDDKGRGYSTTEQDDEVTWNALRAWAESHGYTPFDLYPREEWSEEDEEVRRQLICVLSGGIALKTKETRSKMLEWLKSLRPSWKPSEEQLVTLLRAEGIVRVHDTKELAADLAQLYEQLKKLKEDKK